MQVLEPTTANACLIPQRRRHTGAIDPDKEPGPVADLWPASVAAAHSGSIQTEYAFGHFTEAEVRNMKRDDALAGGMIAVVLGLAFAVLLSLTVCVNIWMLGISP